MRLPRHRLVAPAAARHRIAVEQVAAFVAHAVRALPREASGLLVADRAAMLTFVPTAGRANTRRSFYISAGEIAAVTARLRGSGSAIAGCAHSHPCGSAVPSRHDRGSAEAARRLWLIYSVRRRELALFEWSGGGLRACALEVVGDDGRSSFDSR